MPSHTLSKISESEWTRRFRLRDGREIEIRIEDTLERIDIVDARGGAIGEFEFEVIDEGRHQGYLLVRAYMDYAGGSYKRMGIGREALRFFTESADMQVLARQNDGIRRDDGSHLTEDAPAFVAAMIQEKFIARQIDW